MGIDNRVKKSSQLVQFIIELTEPCEEVRWYKDGKQIDAANPDFKYAIGVEEGIRHFMEVRDIESSDEGFYTFKVNGGEREQASDKVRVKGKLVDKADLQEIMTRNIGAQDDAALIDFGEL